MGCGMGGGSFGGGEELAQVVRAPEGRTEGEMCAEIVICPLARCIAAAYRKFLE